MLSPKNDPLAYADLILNGDPEEYLKNVTAVSYTHLQPLQALKCPKQDALDLGRHLLGNVRVIHTGEGLVLGGQDELTAIETVRAVIPVSYTHLQAQPGTGEAGQQQCV